MKTEKYFPVRCNACGWPGPKPQNINAPSAARAVCIATVLHNHHYETYYARRLHCRVEGGIVIAHFNSLFFN